MQTSLVRVNRKSATVFTSVSLRTPERNRTRKIEGVACFFYWEWNGFNEVGVSFGNEHWRCVRQILPSLSPSEHPSTVHPASASHSRSQPYSQTIVFNNFKINICIIGCLFTTSTIKWQGHLYFTVYSICSAVKPSKLLCLWKWRDDMNNLFLLRRIYWHSLTLGALQTRAP